MRRSNGAFRMSCPEYPPPNYDLPISYVLPKGQTIKTLNNHRRLRKNPVQNLSKIQCAWKKSRCTGCQSAPPPAPLWSTPFRPFFDRKGLSHPEGHTYSFVGYECILYKFMVLSTPHPTANGNLCPPNGGVGCVVVGFYSKKGVLQPG